VIRKDRVTERFRSDAAAESDVDLVAEFDPAAEMVLVRVVAGKLSGVAKG
jgi:predicted nucleotidyltransferase